MPKRTAAEYTAQARKLRHRGEECRTLARLMDTEENAARYLRMAGTYDERQPESPPSSQLQAADVIPAPLPKQVTTTKEKKLPEPEILYPAVLINKSNILETVPLTV
jgi:hypothetical protein